MKRIFNKKEDITLEMCNGIVLSNNELEFIKRYKIIKKKRINMEKVSILSGGGSGHEPSHAGFIGYGMLDCAICGDTFASPSQVQIYHAIKECNTNKGVFIIIKNYSGDVMNFKNAIHLAKEDGIKVDYIIVDDDIAIKNSLYTVGRRGVAGTVFIHKLVGALAELGKDLNEIKKMASNAVASVNSIGFSLSACTLLSSEERAFLLNEDEIEYGVGIHGETGIRRDKIQTADVLARNMVDEISKGLDLKKSDEVAILVNGFGATTMQELYILNNSVIKFIKCKVLKVFVGEYMTSLDMAGASLSILKLDDATKELLFKNCYTMGLSMHNESEQNIVYENVITNKTKGIYKLQTDDIHSEIKDFITLKNIHFIIDKVSQFIINNEKNFCELDSFAGDGDFGTSIAKGFKAIKDDWGYLLQFDSIDRFLQECAFIIMEECRGASGPIWGSAFNAFAKGSVCKDKLTLDDISYLTSLSIKAIQDTGKRSFGRGAVVGDKTLIDALIPFSNSLIASVKKGEPMKKALEDGVKCSIKGAIGTKDIVAKMGRAGIVGERSLGYYDAGAYAISQILKEILSSFIWR